ncbi:MAG: hypothetical protein ABIO71_10880, partial [Caldimonas sp.]
MGRDVPSDSLYWLQSTNVLDFARGFDGQDTTERTYYTGEATPRWTSNAIGLGSPPYPQAYRELGVPAPTGAPVATLTTDGTGTDRTIYYVYTFVNDLGWESAPSPVSTGLVCKPGALVALSAIDAVPGGSYGIDRVRVYRTQPEAGGGANFFFLREIAAGLSTTTDDARALNYQLVTIGMNPLPVTGHSLLALWNGMFAALTLKTLVFSEPSLGPYAFPVKYDRALDDTPVALAKWEQNLLVLTTGHPKLFTGQDPAGMSESGAAISGACVAKRSVVSFEHGVVWASNEGLAYAGNGGNKLLTEGIITAD